MGQSSTCALTYFKGIEMGVQSCYGHNRKEGSFLRQLGTQILKNFGIFWAICAKKKRKKYNRTFYIILRKKTLL